MRLIDADALIEFIDPEHLRHSGELTFTELDVVNMLNHAPETYNLDNVLMRLEYCMKDCREGGRIFEEESAIEEAMKMYAKARCYEAAIRIVKGGGTDEVNRC